MKKIGIVMNSIAEINFKKDSTLLLMSELQNQGKELYYIENLNLYFCLLYTSDAADEE